MANVVVVGSQWGDEGKGKIVDWLSERADVVVRFQGGHNAGHTLVIDGVSYKLSLLPSGIVREGKDSVLGNGVVLDPWAFIAEIEKLQNMGVKISPENLMIAENITLILPLHQELDALREGAVKGVKIGTTKRGIGPAYEDKVGRRALKAQDLTDENVLAEKLKEIVDYHNIIRKGMGVEAINFDDLFDKIKAISPKLTPYIGVAWRKLDEDFHQGRRILFEGAQGTLLDNDHGTYPFVTSSHTVAGQASAGSGLGPNAIDYVLGITKAYTTRVGEGPFPTELDDEVGQRLGERGHEFGTVTGRKRRCGWFDAVLVRQSAKLNGMSGIALTKLDVLDGFDTLKICIGYDIDGKTYDYLPTNMHLQAKAEPIYEEMEGWKETTYGARSWADLPAQAIKYVRRVEELISTPVALLSTSPERNDTIIVKDPYQS